MLACNKCAARDLCLLLMGIIGNQAWRSSYAGIRLIGIGLAVWTVAVAGSGTAIGFWSLVVCRMFVGVGEASFVSLASPFIGKFAPSSIS